MSETVRIPFKRGGEAIIDQIDQDLTEFKWTSHQRGYAMRQIPKEDGKKTTLLLHRVIMSRMLERPISKGEMVDHRDGNTRNNTRANLRLATYTQNCRNTRIQSKSKTGYKGVRIGKTGQSWYATISIDGKPIRLGFYSSPEKAAAAYNSAALEHFGEFARLNIIPGDD